VQELTQDSADSLIGLTEDEARKVAAERGWAVRVAMRDGEAFMLTTDYREDRVNLTVEKNAVTSVQIG
jgi:predicted urease superfamily metal-dependent hydrolase